MVISADRRGPEPEQRVTSNVEINKDDFPGTASEYDMTRDLFTEYKDIFAQSEDDLGHKSTIQHRIQTADERPVVHPCRRSLPAGDHRT